ncbi:MAG: hypothetical protein U0359_32470 [Byssovorax sp.]
MNPRAFARALFSLSKPAPIRAVPAQDRSTWAPPRDSRERSFLPWEELLTPRFPKPPTMPRDLKAPEPVGPGEDTELPGEERDGIWTLDPWSRPMMIR